MDLALTSAIGQHNIPALQAQLTCNGLSYKVALGEQKTITQMYSVTLAMRCRFME